MSNKEILEPFNKLYKIKKMGERTQELIEGIKKQIKIKVEIPVTVTFLWQEGEACSTEFDWEELAVYQNEKVIKSSEEIANKINQEIKEICNFCDHIGIMPDELLEYYEKNKSMC